jgi:transaldolase
MSQQETDGHATALDGLKAHTMVVADTGDFQSIQAYRPRDSTTNPSLIAAASKLPQYAHLVDEALAHARKHAQSLNEQVDLALDKCAVNFGVEILKLVPGRVSTEVDARLSFDEEASVAKGRRLIGLYEAAGVPRERVLIKLASTWQGIQAARRLELDGIHCNLTLLFCLPQAVACADAKVTLISPFVGRITDWHKATHKREYSAAEDPGVLSGQGINAYFKARGVKTQVMGASFRTKEQVLELAGCDLLTISPQLLQELSKMPGPVPRKLTPGAAAPAAVDVSTQSKFEWLLNEDECAHFKLGEGIRKFAADLLKLEADLRARLQKQ